MQKPDYYATLGLEATATAADVEASYLAIVQFLDSKSVPPALRHWAARESALVDEAYAALTEADGEEPAARPAGRGRQSEARAAADGRGRVPPAAAARRRPEEPHYEDDQDEYEELDEDYEIEQPPGPAPVQPGPSRRQEEQEAAKARRGAAAAGQPQWQERGRRPKRGRGPAAPADARGSRTQRRDRAQRGDDRLKKMALGLGVGLAIVLLGFFLVQSGIGPFGRTINQQASNQPPTFDQKRYEDLKVVVEKNPQSFAALFELGQMTFESDRFEESITWLERALQVKPDDVWSMLDIGTANFNLGDREKARETWLKALAIDPNNAQTHWNLSFYYASKQPPDIDAAMQEWQKVLQLAPPGDELAKLAQTHIDQYKSRVGSSTPAATPQP